MVLVLRGVYGECVRLSFFLRAGIAYSRRGDVRSPGTPSLGRTPPRRLPTSTAWSRSVRRTCLTGDVMRGAATPVPLAVLKTVTGGGCRSSRRRLRGDLRPPDRDPRSGQASLALLPSFERRYGTFRRSPDNFFGQSMGRVASSGDLGDMHVLERPSFPHGRHLQSRLRPRAARRDGRLRGPAGRERVVPRPWFASLTTGRGGRSLFGYE